MVAQSNPGAPLDPTADTPGLAGRVLARLSDRAGVALALSAILLAAFALRICLLGDANVWWDEGLAIWAVRLGWARMTLWTASDVHPPVYFWLLKAWVALAGESELAARFLSVICSMVTVAALYPLAKALLGRRVALLATLLLAFARFHVWWSQEMRMYIVATMWGVLSLYMLLRWCMAEGWYSVPRSWRGWYSVPRSWRGWYSVPRSWRGWSSAESPPRPRHPARQALLYVLATAAGLYTLYLFVTVLLIENLFFLYLLLRQNPLTRRRSLMRWVLAQVAVLVLFAPWLAVALPRMRSWSVAEPFSVRVFVQLYATLLTLGISTYVERYAALVAPFFALIVAAMGTLWWPVVRRLRGAPAAAGTAATTTLDDTREARSISLLLGLYLIVPTLVVYVLTRPRGLFYSPRVEARYLVLFAPTFYLLLAWSVDLLHRRVKWVGLAAFLLVAAVFAWALPGHYTGRYLQDDYRSLAWTLRAHHHAKDVVILHNDDGWPVFAYHWASPFVGVPGGWEIDPSTAESFLAPLWQEHAAIWLVITEDALRTDPQRFFEQWLAERAAAQHEWRFGSRRLLAFARTEARAQSLLALSPGFVPASPPRALGESGLTLVGWEQALRRARAGDVAYLAAYVANQGVAGSLEVRLGEPPLATAEAVIAPSVGVIRVPVSVHIPADASTQVAQWHVRLGAAEAAEGALRLTALPVTPANAVKPQNPIDFAFGDPPLVGLLGYDLTGPGTEGGSVQVTLYWQVKGTLSVSYKVFTHLVNAQGQVQAQRDDYPAHGSRPTTGWVTGEIVIDRYEIPIAGHVPTGTYTLKVGLYDPATGDRLSPVRDAAGSAQLNDQVVLDTIDIVGQ